MRGFFNRVKYQIGDYLFSPDDIEHGILRGNARPPYSISRQFRKQDPRNAFVIPQPDPRSHFTLVCGAAYCPPIGVYAPDKLDEQLTIATESYLNSGNVVIDKQYNQVQLSRIFKWYGRDFGKTGSDRLHYIIPYLYDADDRAYLEKHIDTIGVHYLDYDWRLNN